MEMQSVGNQMAEYAAYVGAAAWLQSVLYIWLKHINRPKLKLIPAEKITIGYNERGPVLVLKSFIASSVKEMIVDGIEVVLVHEKGDSSILSWDFYNETISEVEDYRMGTKQEFKRSGEAIALKLNPVSYINQYFWFSIRPFRNTAYDILDVFKEKVLSLIRARSIDWETVDKLDEYRRYENYMANNFHWREGRYDVKFMFSSPQKFKNETCEYYFVLNSSILQKLRSNLDNLLSNAKGYVGIDGFHDRVPFIYPQVYLMRK